MTFEIILAAMLSLAPYVGDRSDSPEARRKLYEPVARAIAKASKGDRQTAAALIAMGYHESRFARYVLEGRCADGPPGQRCDQGRARGPWQVHAWCRDAWTGEDQTAAGAACAARMLRHGLRRCGSWDRAFSLPAAQPCIWPGSKRRAMTMRAVTR